MLNFFLLLIGGCFADFLSSRTISLSMNSRWGSVPLVDQIFHFCHQYSNELGEQFLFAITKKNGEIIKNENLLFDAVNQIIPKHLQPILNASLDLGSEIPQTIFHGFYSEKETQNYDSKIQNYHYKTDFVYCGDQVSDETAYQNILYADIQHNSTYIHNLLSKKIPFVLRTTPVSLKNTKKSKLHGYGIELRPFKYSMEYGIKNENNDENIPHNIPENFQNDDNISSFSFANFGSKFASFWSEHIEQSNNDFLTKLREITTNWPLYLKEITETPIDADLQAQIQTFLNPNARAAYLNGRLLTLDNIDAFTFLNTIKEETTTRDILHYLNFSKSEIDRISSISFKNHDIFFFDYNHPKVSYYNNIETEKRYESFTDDITQIDQFHQRLVKIRKNLLKTVLYFDPTTVEGLNSFYFLIYFTTTYYPITAGILPIFRMNSELSRKVAFAYHHLLIHNPKEAMSFLIHSVKYMDIDKSTSQIINIKEEGFAQAYEEIKTKNKNKKRWAHLNELYDVNSDEFKSIQEIAKYYQSKNLQLNTASMNGHIFSFKEITSRIMINEINTIMTLITPLIKKIGKKANNMDIFDIIKQSNKYPIVTGFDRIFNDHVTAVNINEFSFDEQKHFLYDFEKIEYYRVDRNTNYDTYAFLFTNKEFSKNGIDAFIDRMNKNLTKSKIKFSINPRVNLHLEESNFPILVINGRIIQNFNYTDPNELNSIDQWNFAFVVHFMSKFHLHDNSKQKFYLNTLLNCWRAKSISRGSLDFSKIFSPESPLKFVQSHNPDLLNLSMVVNPFNRNFQRLSYLIEYFHNHHILNVEICLNPVFHESHHLTTLSSFYRSSITEDELNFTMLSDRTTYSSMIDVPNSWQVESLKSEFDLDNIFLSELKSSFNSAEYLLTGLVIEGTCYTKDNQPAANAKLSLNHQQDTTVMNMNNGYFQLIGQVGPNIISFDDSNQVLAEVNGFALQKITFRLLNTTRKDLDDSIKKLRERQSYKNTTRVDVFSVASGHLYERLIKIMMISAKRNTTPTTNLTFWIINNFLSPQFKAELPKISKQYNFNYKLVQYKWPNWLHPQYEKQRIIWANKILFLDVLFPYDLDRVIYVDADQIVRTDLNELMKMDFDNAPYAFTPFCDSRVETEPYRFWKSGYWKRHLETMSRTVAYSKNEQIDPTDIKPFKYHISALFAVDLPRFREMNAGDVLRFTYHYLSQDEQSLANLDQDLPNYLQDQLPIFSLPQDWLWCETWCSDESMKSAKNIDLCNNPLTKVSKLEIARHRVEEWPGLDKEAANIVAEADEYEKNLFA